MSAGAAVGEATRHVVAECGGARRIPAWHRFVGERIDLAHLADRISKIRTTDVQKRRINVLLLCPKKGPHIPDHSAEIIHLGPSTPRVQLPASAAEVTGLLLPVAEHVAGAGRGRRIRKRISDLRQGRAGAVISSRDLLQGSRGQAYRIAHLLAMGEGAELLHQRLKVVEREGNMHGVCHKPGSGEVGELTPAEPLDLVEVIGVGRPHDAVHDGAHKRIIVHLRTTAPRDDDRCIEEQEGLAKSQDPITIGELNLVCRRHRVQEERRGANRDVHEPCDVAGSLAARIDAVRRFQGRHL